MGQKYLGIVTFILLFSVVVFSFQVPSSDVSSPYWSDIISKTAAELKQEILRPQVQGIGNKVLLQPYYWDMPDSGSLWRALSHFIPQFSKDGFDSLWLPPMSKTRPGHPATGGYEPLDYYDLGEFNQSGRIRTRYGTRQELQELTTLAHQNNLAVIADIVINHRMGGKPEFNPFVNDFTETNFMEIISNKLKMNYSHFWPNAYGTGDMLQYGSFPDISHAHPYVQSELIKWGKWLQDEIGFDGWRFDTAGGIDPYMLKYWMQNITDTWGVAEYWMSEPDREVMLDYVAETNDTVNIFDFPLLVHLRQMANANGSYDMTLLEDAGIVATHPKKAVTFAVNHDTYRDLRFDIKTHRDLAYAYILTHPGYPSVFWMDYVNLDLRNLIKNLVDIHNQYAQGAHSILHVDSDLYVAQREGEPGLIIAINDNPKLAKSASVTTKWTNTILYELTGHSSKITTDPHGKMSITVPPSSFVIYSHQPTTTKQDDSSSQPAFEKNVIHKKEIALDGELDINWGLPTYRDELGDAQQQHTDLTHLFLGYEGEFLYLGLGYYHLNAWKGDEIQYAIALDTQKGGSTADPLSQSNIKWGGTSSSQKPDYMYYLDTSLDENYFRKITKATRYEFKDTWNSFETQIKSTSSKMLGFIEIKIPLNELDIPEAKLAIKVFTTTKEFNGVKDSIPHDSTIDPSGESVSWLFMSDPLEIDIEVTTKTSNLEIMIIPSVLLLIPILLKYAYKKDRMQRQ